jgi:rare lipoprotein A
MNMIRPALTFAFCVMLTACGGGGSVKPGSAPSTDAPKRGGYYLDDGPGNNPPLNIDSIPDAAPRTEPLLARANRPYSALGKRYTPATEYRPYKESGIASWYGKRYHGQKTSSGEVYDMYGMSGAHPTLPLPSYVRVTNPENGRSVVVRINDRGPFLDNRLIDLSYAAAYKLRLIEKGHGEVIVEAIDTRPDAPRETPATAAAVVPAEAQPVPLPAPVAPVVPPEPAKATQASGIYVQVGAFKHQENADRLREKLEQNRLSENVPLQSWYNQGTYRVRLGPYTSRQDAERAVTRIRQALGTSAIVIYQ